MPNNCLEDGFTYNIERAAKDYADQFDNEEEAIKDFHRNATAFAWILYQQAETYTDIEAEIRKAFESKKP